MNAIFDEGPYGEDVGRCVPGPPPVDEFVAKGVTYFAGRQIEDRGRADSRTGTVVRDD